MDTDEKLREAERKLAEAEQVLRRVWRALWIAIGGLIAVDVALLILVIRST